MSLSIDAIRPLNRWDCDHIRPGNVGSVGSVDGYIRIKRSSPDDSVALESIGNPTFVGSIAKTIDSNWGGRKHFKTSHGWYMQDMRAPDKVFLFLK